MSVAAVPRALVRSYAPKSTTVRVVALRRSRAAGPPFVAVVVLILTLGLLGLLAVNTVLAQDAFRLHALQADGRALADREQALQRELRDLQSPLVLAARATELGMVPGGAPAFLDLAGGEVLGRPAPGAAPVVIAPAIPPATTKAKAAALPTTSSPRWRRVSPRP
jgi:cell division protein FtsB